MKVWIETERLILRPLAPDDAEAVFRWGGDPVVNEYMIYPLYHRVEDVRTWLESRNPDDPDSYDEGIVLKSTGELIGSGGLVYHPERNAWEIGYNLRADQWGHGYTVEMLNALMDYIRKTRPIDAIDGVFAAENHKSQRVMEKLGMSFVRDTEYTKLDGSRTYPAKYYRRDFTAASEEKAPSVIIRRMAEQDATAVSELIITTIRISNTKDYPVEMMEELAKTQTPEHVLQRAAWTHFYVAEEEGKIVGCGAIGPYWGKENESSLFSIFVHPDEQGKGIGRKIIQTLEKDEFALRAKRIEIPASATAVHFYQKMGYTFKNGCEEMDDEHLYRMEKSV